MNKLSMTVSFLMSKKEIFQVMLALNKALGKETERFTNEIGAVEVPSLSKTEISSLLKSEYFSDGMFNHLSETNMEIVVQAVDVPQLSAIFRIIKKNHIDELGYALRDFGISVGFEDLT